MKALLKYESLYLRDVVRNQRQLKPLPRGWRWHYLLLTLTVYLAVDLVLSLSFGYGLYTLFTSYFELYNDEEIEGLFLLMVLAAPIAEELLFRLPMLYDQVRLKCWFMLFALILFSLHWIVGLSALIFAIYLTGKDFDQITRFDLKSLHSKYSKAIFWLLTISFALVHTTNFDLEQLPIYAYPIVVATQLIGGIVLGLVRIRFGLRYAMIHHAVFNLIAYTLS